MLGALAFAVLPKHAPIHVEGNRLVDDGKTVSLRAVILPGMETAAGGDNVFRSLRVAAEDWKFNCVVLPLSQDRWVGKIKGEKQHGEEYRGAVDDVLTYVQKSGLYAIVQLASSDKGKWGQNLGPHQMPDKNSEEFWRQIARRYGGYENVLFDLYADPHGVDGKTWLSGGQVVEGTETYQTPGVQGLVDDIRKAGAMNVIVLNGLGLPADEETLSMKDEARGRGLAFELTDASPDPFPNSISNKLHERAPIFVKWSQAILGVTFLWEPGIGYVAGAMDPESSFSLIKDWKYTPNGYGDVIMKRLAESAN